MNRSKITIIAPLKATFLDGPSVRTFHTGETVWWDSKQTCDPVEFEVDNFHFKAVRARFLRSVGIPDEEIPVCPNHNRQMKFAPGLPESELQNPEPASLLFDSYVCPAPMCRVHWMRDRGFFTNEGTPRDPRFYSLPGAKKR